METKSKLSAKEIKEGMSNGLWKSNFHDSGRYGADITCDLGELPNRIMSIRTVAICLKNGTTEENTSNPEAIIQAVNGTWLNGINPESVGDLLEALKNLVEKCLHTDGYNQKIDELFQAQQAIKKATIK